MYATLAAVARHLPPGTLTNTQLAAQFPGTRAEQIHRLSGITTRHIAAADVTPSDLAYAAAQQLFSSHPEHPREDIDALLFCSEGLDYKAPASACLLHERLDLKRSALAMDIPGGCTGFVNGLLLAQSLITGSSTVNNVLLLTAEAVSRVLHDDDLHLRMLFGDGACATLVTRSPTRRIGEFVVGTDGSGAKTLWVERSGFREPADAQWLEMHQDTTHGMKYGRLIMQGDELLHFALTRVPGLVRETLAVNALALSDIDLFIFHQASKIILNTLKRKIKIPDEKFMVCLDTHANTVSSSIPLALHEALCDGRAPSGSKVMLVGFGVGLSWGATVIDIP